MIQKWFKDLYADRLENARVLKKASMSGVKDAVSDKYSDPAHFVYELLQNADDVGATRAEFELLQDKLIFIHNGKRHFSISNPETEKADKLAGKLGDINAITSIGNSSKSISPATIGKFGVGFKAVFQYTDTPEIWDKDFSFRIENFIVPVPLSGDCPYKKAAEETLFVFPFDKSEMPKTQAFKEINKKLKNLSYPLLFLSNLRELIFKIGEFQGFYKKNILAKNQYEDITEEQIQLSENRDGTAYWLNFILFSRPHPKGSYSVCYSIRAGKLIPIEKPAFCFFQTKEYTGLRFLIHAPFLLTDSREGIFQGKLHNINLIESLADLAADSLTFLRDRNLIDDNILDIIPITESNNDLFKIFYKTIQFEMKTRALIPALDSATGNYNFVKSKNAYWAEVINLTKIFSDNQLAEIVPNTNARWVFVSKSREKADSKIEKYILEIVQDSLNENVILKGRNDPYSRQINKTVRGITANFIEKQTFEWLHKFYKWLSETSARINAAKTLPLFLNTKGKAVVAFENSLPKLFLPMVGGSDYPTVHPELLANPNTKSFLINRIGIKSPSLKDEIESKVFSQYDKLFHENSSANDSGYFQKIFEYYLQLPGYQLESYIENLKKHLWLRCISKNPSDFVKYSRPKYSILGYEAALYIPSEGLKKYFQEAKRGRFVDYDFYLNLVGRDKENKLIKFFTDLGLAREVQYVRIYLGENFAKAYKLPKENSTREEYWYEYQIEGCTQILRKIPPSQNNSDAYKKSLILWKRLVAVNQKVGELRDKMRGTYEYFNRKQRFLEFTPILVQELRTLRWLVDKNGKLKKAEEISVQSMAEGYDTVSQSAQSLIDFLGIKEKSDKGEDEPKLSIEQLNLIKYGKLIEAAMAKGASLEQIQQMLQNLSNPITPPEPPKPPNQPKPPRPKKPITEIQAKIGKLNIEGKNDNGNDGWTPPTVDYKKKIERLKQKSELEQEQLAQLEELQKIVMNSEKYSYGWFKACLELEFLNSNENKINSREISISFGRVEKAPNTSRTLILKYPSRFIPQFMEDLENIPLNLKTKNESAKVTIEVISVQHNILRVKLKDGSQVENINLAEVKEATINAQNPVFLLEELKKQFNNLNYADNFNMRKNLCKNIEFVFGPPGTGKTTYLARKVILPLMQLPQNKKILVLTPTNKAADVLTKKIMDSTKNFDWLIRFGTTNDEIIEKTVYREKTFDIRKKPRNVTITTIARFPYDFFMIDGERFHLHAMNWDYIIIDEASMIPLINIILPLYLKTPEKFIIAGDPFQIEPVISLDFWKDENIYTLVELNSFTASKTVPHNYKIIKLMTQYRSLPSIGEVFSKLTYGGILKHYRNENQKRPLKINNWLNIKSLNIIKFPVSEYESVYRAKRINNSSSYQAYSAIFTFEFVSAMSRQISKNNPNENFSIGIIAPYRVQADLIEKLFATAQISPNIQISASTIHGFQGDECDIIFVVFNPPPYISGSSDMFLNHQNIINVSISRAQDYLFLIMPDDNTKNIFNLQLIKQVEKLFHNFGYSEFNSSKIENLIFGRENHIEENSFSTGHQNVNIYTKPERVYEIRSDDNAVDIQIHKDFKFVKS